jgi:predicted ATPase
MKIENSIVFEGFKVIKQGFTLKNLAKINYLVGPNGSGKSTLLNMLYNEPNRVRVRYFDGNIIRSKRLNSELQTNLESILTDYEYFDEYASSYFELDENYESSATIEGYNKIQKEHKEFNIQNEIKAITSWNPKIYHFISLNNDLFSQDIYKKLLDIYSFDNYIFEHMNENAGKEKDFTIVFIRFEEKFIKFINKISKIQFKEIVRDKISGNLLLKSIDNHTFELNSFSDGQKKLISLYFELVSLSQTNERNNLEMNYDGYEEQGVISFEKKSYPVGIRYENYILIDEPELSLHPKFQKMISEMLDSFAFDNINFIIATHSPFIISENTKYKNTKTYFIEYGQTIDRNSILNSEESMNGYEGANGILAMGELIGVNPSDLTADIVFCEKTLSIILTSITERFPPNKKIIFTPAMGGGDSSIINSLAQILKFNINNLNYIGIVDNCAYTIKSKKENVLENLDESQNLEKQFAFKKLVEATKKIIILNYDELEKSYKLELVNEYLKNLKINNWDGKKDFSADFLKSELSLKSNLKKGEIKENLAEYIKDYLDTDFVKLISMELYNYIYGNKYL